MQEQCRKQKNLSADNPTQFQGMILIWFCRMFLKHCHVNHFLFNGINPSCFALACSS